MGGGWHLWAALIIGAVIWIVGQLLRNSAQQEEKRTPPPLPPGRGPAPRRPAPASAELDRFLQEVNRRKQVAEQRSRAQTENRPAAVPQARSSVDAPLAARPARASSPPPVRRRPARAAEAPQRRSPEAEAPVLLEVVPAVQPGPAAPVVVEVVRPAPAPVKATPFPAAQAKSGSPAVRQLFAMLNSKDNLRAAILLREVLDAPLCHRRR